MTLENQLGSLQHEKMEPSVLRDVIDSDLPIFFEHQLDPTANLMAAFPARDHDAFMSHWRTKVLGNGTVVKKSIIVAGDVVGNILSWEQSNKRLVGYWIGKEYWGKGIATQALAELLSVIKARPLYAYAIKHNRASTRVLEKCGFTPASHGMTFSKIHGQ